MFTVSEQVWVAKQNRETNDRVCIGLLRLVVVGVVDLVLVVAVFVAVSCCLAMVLLKTFHYCFLSSSCVELNPRDQRKCLF